MSEITMDSTVIAAIITTIGTIAAALIGLLALYRKGTGSDDESTHHREIKEVPNTDVMSEQSARDEPRQASRSETEDEQTPKDTSVGARKSLGEKRVESENMTASTQNPLRILCSYSHRDEKYLNELRTSLRPLERQGLIEWWHDRKIVPGWEWEEDIDKHLRTADVILLLVSRAFMASDYVYEKEIGVAVERHERGDARVIPIILRPAYWVWASFGKLQALPKDAKPITSWPDPDDAWLDVVKGVRRAVGELFRERHEQAARDQYAKAVEKAWVDEELSDAEAERLDALASELGLNTESTADIEREVAGDTVGTILERQEEAARQEERSRRLEELYTQARRSLQNQEWQAVVDVFAQIHAVEPTYSDPEQLFNSARKALETLERMQRVASLYDRGQRHMNAKEWQQALECFEEVQRLESGFRETEELLSRVRRELAPPPKAVVPDLRASVNRRVVYVSRDAAKAIESHWELPSTKRCQPIGGAS
jgi:tetratricopeptide (TPR) repeat protein